MSRPRCLRKAEALHHKWILRSQPAPVCILATTSRRGRSGGLLEKQFLRNYQQLLYPFRQTLKIWIRHHNRFHFFLPPPVTKHRRITFSQGSQNFLKLFLNVRSLPSLLHGASEPFEIVNPLASADAPGLSLVYDDSPIRICMRELFLRLLLVSVVVFVISFTAAIMTAAYTHLLDNHVAVADCIGFGLLGILGFIITLVVVFLIRAAIPLLRWFFRWFFTWRTLRTSFDWIGVPRSTGRFARYPRCRRHRI